MGIIVIGGGQAAASFVAKYRALGATQAITIIGDEPVYPYQRPPLSKSYLLGELELERLYLRPIEWYQKNAIDFRANTRVHRIDRANKTVVLESGEQLEYQKLLIATGARARELPASLKQNAKGLYTVRNLADVEGIRAQFQPQRKLLVIGGGYIGLEAAAVARKLGLEVVLIEAAERILGRVASAQTADFIRALHQRHGVEIIEGQGIKQFLVEQGQFKGLVLNDEREIRADFAIQGVGILSNSELAEDAGLECQQGILVDGFCLTSDPDIYAAGDCTCFDFQGKIMRIESVGNAIHQGEIAAANLGESHCPRIRCA